MDLSSAFWQKKWGILIKKESESLDFTGLKIPRDYMKEWEEFSSWRDVSDEIGGSYERIWSDEELKQGYLNN